MPAPTNFFKPGDIDPAFIGGLELTAICIGVAVLAALFFAIIVFGVFL